MRNERILLGGGIILFVVLAAGGFFIAGGESFDLSPVSFMAEEPAERSVEKLANPPEVIKGIYVTSWIAGTARMEQLIQLVEETELNAVVIDVKDATGYLSFPTDIPLAQQIRAQETRISDIDTLIRRLHKRNIYVIGRVQTFQDPVLAAARPDLAITDSRTGAIWRDHKNLAWLDPGHREVWEYIAAIASAMDAHGFDEINLDYVRFPSDGEVEYMSFPVWDQIQPRYEVIRSFFSYMREYADTHDIRISADIFGMTTLFTQHPAFDLYIGQRLADALETFHIVSPMVYPSHYGPGVLGFTDPAAHPYEIVYASMQEARALQATTTNAAQLRPWLQDFDIGADYTATAVRAQIQAVYDAGIDSWLLWNSTSRYTRGALLPAE